MEKRSLGLIGLVIVVVFLAAGGEARNVRVKRQATDERRTKKLMVDGFMVSTKKKVRDGIEQNALYEVESVSIEQNRLAFSCSIRGVPSARRPGNC